MNSRLYQSKWHHRSLRGRGVLPVAAVVLATMGMSPTEPAVILIDDFSTGDYHAAVSREAHENTPGEMLGGSRASTVTVTRNPYRQTANIDVLAEAGVMAVNTGIQSLVRVELRYGYDERGGANPLNLDLSRHETVTIDLAANDRPINYNVVLFSAGPSQRASMAMNIPAKASAQSVRLPLSRFQGTPGFDLGDVDHIAIIFQSTGAEAGNDFALSEVRIDG